MTDNSYFHPKSSFTDGVKSSAPQSTGPRFEIGEIFGDVVDRLSAVVDNARRPGKPLDTLGKITRQAPLGALFVAFLAGMAFARRR